MLDEQSPTRHIPLHLNEYTISWTWQTQDERMKNYKGATCAWNERDGVYGKMDGDCNLLPSANVFHLLNAYGVGNIHVDFSERPKPGRLRHPRPEDGKPRLLLLINESQMDSKTVTVRKKLIWQPWPVNVPYPDIHCSFS